MVGALPGIDLPVVAVIWGGVIFRFGKVRNTESAYLGKPFPIFMINQMLVDKIPFIV
jgi:hypothetical protein